MKKVLRDPLFHFLLLGAGLFLVYHLCSKPGRGSDSGKIVVTQAQIQHLTTAYTAAFQRPPTAPELKGLIDDYVREEVAVREATALNLGQDDTVIRRRLRQKFEFVSDDIASRAEPTESELEAYLKAHADKFSSEPNFTFIQIYLNPDKHKDLDRDAAQLLVRLQGHSRPDVSRLGDVSLLEQRYTEISLSEVAKRFGDRFAKALAEVQPGQWQGPAMSGYGAHLVNVTKRTEGRMPALADVREVVKRDWMDDRRRQVSGKLYQNLLERYTVSIEKTQPPAGKEIASK